METGQQYWDVLKARICAKCVDGDARGGCRLPHERFCTIQANLPAVVEVVNAVYSPSIEPYVEKLRTTVCKICALAPGGDCRIREDLECPLDRYFPLVVEVIEQVQLMTAARGA